jgi:hypothetical protein
VQLLDWAGAMRGYDGNGLRRCQTELSRTAVALLLPLNPSLDNIPLSYMAANRYTADMAKPALAPPDRRGPLAEAIATATCRQLRQLPATNRLVAPRSARPVRGIARPTAADHQRIIRMTHLNGAAPTGTLSPMIGRQPVGGR